MPRALEGTTVITLEQAVAAPLATSRLADAGARVIKLERLEGDFARGYDSYAKGQSSYFVWTNRGKESCRVDLKLAEDRELVDTMLASADIFVQNLAPGATDRLGIGSEKLRAMYPGLIVCDISGYAAGTPDYFRKAYDLLVQAESGLSGITGSQESGPSRVGISICDIATGQAAYAAILEAIITRQHSGQGSHIQLSLFDTMAEYMNVPYLAQRYGGQAPMRMGLAHPSIAPYGVFDTEDGQILIAIQNEREWEGFCQAVLGEPGLATDPRYAGNTARVRNRDVLDAHVQSVLGKFNSEELSSLLDDVRIAYGHVSRMEDLVHHKSATMAAVETESGTVELLAPPALVNGHRPALGRVPALGEQDEAIRAEFGRRGVPIGRSEAGGLDL